MRNIVLIAAFALTLAWTARAADTSPPKTTPPPADLSTPPAAAPAPEAPPAPAPAAAAADTSAPSGNIEDLQKQLTDNQDKLSTALHSYEVLNDENRQLKEQADKLASEKAALEGQIEELRRSNSFYQAQEPIVAQVDSLRMQLRQSQNQTGALAEELSELKTRLALSGSGAPTSYSAPTRPSAGRAIEFSPPVGLPASPALSAPLSPPAEASPSAAPAKPEQPKARTYTVANGDTLSKISKQFYGTANRWDDILKANRGTLKDENHVEEGMKLVIP